MKGDALLYAHEGLYDLGIIAFEQSPYTHVALDLGDGRLIESMQPNGVRVRPIVHDETMTRWRIAPDIRPTLNLDYACDVALTQVGRPYDVPGIVDVVVRHRLLEHHGWFCSELADAFYAWAGYLIDQGGCDYVVPSRFSQPPFCYVGAYD